MTYSSVQINAPARTTPLISGSMVARRTSESIWITICPPRWISPKIGGFSLSSVPRPRSPLRRLRRPGRPLSATTSGCPLWPATT